MTKLGSGGFGQVFKVKHLKSGKYYALKRFYTEVSLLEPQEELALQRTLAFHSSMNHPMIVRFIDSFYDTQDKVCLVNEYIEVSDLEVWMRQRFVKEGGEFTVPEILRMFTMNILGLRYLHSRGIVHRDIKPSNILIGSMNSKPFAKICDFDLSKEVGTKTEDASLKLNMTVKYAAPEQIDGKTASLKVDAWSIGVILFQLCAIKGQHPFDNSNLSTTIKNILMSPP